MLEPETTSSLLDNATGSSNFAAKGAHRLQLSIALAKYARDATIPTTFIQLVDIKEDKVIAKVVREDLNIIGKTLARRTFDESGDYTVKPFNVVVRESTDLNDAVGIYTTLLQTHLLETRLSLLQFYQLVKLMLKVMKLKKYLQHLKTLINLEILKQ